ncbi:MAG TPA: hypothetical protein VJI15_06005 [Candidatus Nanoarchaeia archaeon]|nr:hypothetical protein [Candidatus Nanoarchaeia archaeon]
MSDDIGTITRTEFIAQMKVAKKEIELEVHSSQSLALVVDTMMSLPLTLFTVATTLYLNNEHAMNHYVNGVHHEGVSDVLFPIAVMSTVASVLTTTFMGYISRRSLRKEKETINQLKELYKNPDYLNSHR